ncbi:MAG: hypothetical protein WB609_02245 [Candidatus Cybelea sp.]
MNTSDSSEAWIRQGANVLAGALVAFIVFSGMRHAQPLICVVDSAILAAWAQVAAIILTGGLAVWVAWTQLRRFNENERAKTTLEYVQRYTQDLHQTQHEPVTISFAVSRLMNALVEDEVLRLKALARRWYADREELATDSTALDEYLRFNNMLALSLNFMSKTALLADQGFIDSDLFLGIYSAQAQRVWRLAETYADVEPVAKEALDSDLLRAFVEQARHICAIEGIQERE